MAAGVNRPHAAMVLIRQGTFVLPALNESDTGICFPASPLLNLRHNSGIFAAIVTIWPSAESRWTKAAWVVLFAAFIIF